jgi:hypothetical protein
MQISALQLYSRIKCKKLIFAQKIIAMDSYTTKVVLYSIKNGLHAPAFIYPRIPRHHNMETLIRAILRNLTDSVINNLVFMIINVHETKEYHYISFANAEYNKIRKAFITHRKIIDGKCPAPCQ